MKKKKPLTILQKLMLSYIALTLGILIFLLAFFLPEQIDTMNSNLKDKISGTARLLADDSQIRAQTQAGVFQESLIARLDRILADTDRIDYIVIADTSSIRLYHPDHTQIGRPFQGGDEAAVLSGSAPYITERKGTVDVQLRAFHAITGDDGRVIGFIMVSSSMKTIVKARNVIIMNCLLLFAAALGVGILFSYMISRGIRKTLLGYEPVVFTKMYQQREQVLDNLAEGIAAVSTDGIPVYVNPAAEAMLTDSVQAVRSAPLAGWIHTCIEEQQKRTDEFLEKNDNTLIVSIYPLSRGQKKTGALLVFRDRTESVRMAEQLTGTNHIIEALRANTHEFRNELHVISGLLQLGEVQQAVDLIEGAGGSQNSGTAILNQIENKTIAALLLGKQNRARELDIEFTLQKDSVLPPHNPFLHTKEEITIIGNLIENAFEAMPEDAPVRQVNVFLSCGEEGITISVDDTGSGMTAEQVAAIRAGRFTTKEIGRAHV